MDYESSLSARLAPDLSDRVVEPMNADLANSGEHIPAIPSANVASISGGVTLPAANFRVFSVFRSSNLSLLGDFASSHRLSSIRLPSLRSSSCSNPKGFIPFCNNPRPLRISETTLCLPGSLLSKFCMAACRHRGIISQTIMKAIWLSLLLSEDSPPAHGCFASGSCHRFAQSDHDDHH